MQTLEKLVKSLSLETTSPWLYIRWYMRCYTIGHICGSSYKDKSYSWRNKNRIFILLSVAMWLDLSQLIGKCHWSNFCPTKKWSTMVDMRLMFKHRVHYTFILITPFKWKTIIILYMSSNIINIHELCLHPTF